MLFRVVENIFCYNLDNGEILRVMIVKIEMERIDTQEGVTVEALLDSGVIVKNIDDRLQFLFPFLFYSLVFFISRLFSIFRTRVRV